MKLAKLEKCSGPHYLEHQNGCIPPFATVIELNERIKQHWVRRFLEPPALEKDAPPPGDSHDR